MKKAQVLLLSSVFVAPMCSAAEDNYISIQVGDSSPTKKASVVVDKNHPYRAKIKDSATFGASIGHKVYNNLFAELEYSYTPNYSLSKTYEFIDSGTISNISTATKIRSHSFFANFNYLIKNNTLPFTPYLTGGIGFANNKTKNVNTTTIHDQFVIPATYNGKSKTNFAWQIGAGSLFSLNKSWDVNVAVKYKDLGNVQSSSTNYSLPVKGRLSVVNLMIGLNYKF